MNEREDTREPEAARKLRVAVVFGGRSSEHAISCVTAGSVLRVIDRDRFDVIPVGITPQGRWVLAPDDPQRLAISDGRLPEVDEAGDTVILAGDPTSRELVVTESGGLLTALGAVDVVLPLLHGPYGEDGTIQGLFELAGIRYVGSGVLSSAIGMDKHYMKVVLAGSGLPVARYVVIQPRDWEGDRAAIRKAVGDLGWPVFVKPARGGSSIGITKVDAAYDFDEAVDRARELDPKVLVEEAVDGREIECGVLESPGGGPPETSLPGEIRVDGSHEFYDFDAKYIDEEHVDLIVPAPLPAPTADEVRRLAADAFTALSCEGLARVDFFLRPDGSLVVNEVNTMPGFTPTSMFPRMWAATGVDYPALVDRLLTTALRRPLGLR